VSHEVNSQQSSYLGFKDSPVVDPELTTSDREGVEAVSPKFVTFMLGHSSLPLPSLLKQCSSLLLSVNHLLLAPSPELGEFSTSKANTSGEGSTGTPFGVVSVSFKCVAQSEVRLLALETPESVVLVSALNPGLSWLSEAS